MKNLFLTALIALVAAIPAHAQTAPADPPRRFELDFNPISYLRHGGENLWGGTLALAMRRSDRLSYVADVSIHQTRPPISAVPGATYSNPTTASAYRFGLRYYAQARGKFRPFAEGLAGGAILGAVTTTTNGVGNKAATTTTVVPSHHGVSFAVGGGVDRTIRPWLSWRVFQADYSFSHAGRTFNDVQIHTGAVFHFGH